MGWVGLGGGGGVVFYFVDTVLFCRTVFVGRWVAMVLTSSSCNLGIDNYR